MYPYRSEPRGTCTPATDAVALPLEPLLRGQVSSVQGQNSFTSSREDGDTTRVLLFFKILSCTAVAAMTMRAINDTCFFFYRFWCTTAVLKANIDTCEVRPSTLFSLRQYSYVYEQAITLACEILLGTKPDCSFTYLPWMIHSLDRRKRPQEADDIVRRG